MRDLAILQQALMPLSEWAELGIDDFGTQHSSMLRLSSLQGIISFLKIDRFFMPTDQKDEGAIAIYECFVKLAKVFSLKTVAEGIENDIQLQLCKSIGVDYAQGFYFSRAKAWEDLETVG